MSQTTVLRRQRRALHFDALVQRVRTCFQKLPEQRRCPQFSLADTLMAGLALYSLKDPSLLAFQRRAADHNLRSVFGLQAIPCDTQMRTILDDVQPDQVRPLFKDIFRPLQRGKVLEDYAFLDEGYLVALDGVEYFRSAKVHCRHCLTCQHDDGSVSYYHQMLGAVILHPDLPEVIALAPEPIQRQDGQGKNDCERNAARRWLQRFRQDHRHLNVIIVEDALSSNAPHIRDLQRAHAHFILGVKPGDHQYLFEQVSQRERDGSVAVLQFTDANSGVMRRYTFLHDVAINDSNQEVRVNFLKYQEILGDEVLHEWTWVTDLQLTPANVERVARAGRARWHIENETFNTLKNQGYHFEHNYGHGQENLAVVLALLMMLAFLIDQVQQKCNPLFRSAWEKKGPKCALWEAIRNLFTSFTVSSMRAIYEAIAYGYERPWLAPLVEQALVAAARETADTS
jgi:Transposase DDE domain